MYKGIACTHTCISVSFLMDVNKIQNPLRKVRSAAVVTGVHSVTNAGCGVGTNRRTAVCGVGVSLLSFEKEVLFSPVS